jgi:hemoglobin
VAWRLNFSDGPAIPGGYENVRATPSNQPGAASQSSEPVRTLRWRGRSMTPFEQIGGVAAVEALSRTFYDRMQENEPELAALHALDETGAVKQETRDRFALFLVGWLGGPQDYMARHGHPRLRMRHAAVPINIKMRDAWLRCMNQALAECNVPASLRGFLEQRFAEVADFLRNTEEV